ncbi:MAG TPA: hypothetical protein VND68_14450 [Chloroflexia bacterium]|jgi:hypothetical protein|nr:hypothetical protein [Chloroflexia bacterium]
MFAEQTTLSRLPTSESEHLEVKMLVHLELPTSEYGPLREVPTSEYGPNVSIWLKYEPKLPEHVQDALHARLFNGVHGGLYESGFRLPSGGVYVELQELAISSPTDTFSLDGRVEQIGNLLEHVMSGTVSTLFSVCGNAASLAKRRTR